MMDCITEVNCKTLAVESVVLQMAGMLLHFSETDKRALHARV